MDPQISVNSIYKDLQNVIAGLSSDNDNDGPFNLDSNDLEKRRYEMVVAQKQILDDLPDITNFTSEGIQNEAMKTLKNEVKSLSRLMEQENSLISDWEELSSSSKNSLKDLESLLVSLKNAKVDKSKCDSSKQDFLSIKRCFQLTLQKYYPNVQEHLEYILSKLENKRDDDEDPWTEITDEMNNTAFLILLKSNIIEQHPQQPNLIKFVSFTD